MAPYDSDSDSDDAANQTTNVLLGYASDDPTEDPISIIGGEPSWLDPAAPPSAALARCTVCHDLMAQLLQLHADLPEHFPTHERRLHVFACRRRTCKRKPGSIRALRTTRAATRDEAPRPEPAVAPQARPPSPPRNLGSSIFGGSGSGGSLFGASPKAPTDSLATTFAAKASIAAALDTPSAGASAPVAGPPPPPEPWPLADHRAKPYPAYYMDAAYEELDDDMPSSMPAASSAATTAVDAADSAGDDLDAFESTLDRAFQRFASRLAQNPEQVLRYEFRGAPLLYAHHDAVGKLLSRSSGGGGGGGGGGRVAVTTTAGTATGMPACSRCGAARVFELQLVPQAIAELEANDPVEPTVGADAKAAATAAATAALDGMEWGTILVGVCGRDCAGAAGECVHVEEWAGVQWEELERR